MKHSGKVDQDDIVWARNVLLASGRRTEREEVDAYRVLAQVGPAAYLPRLVSALLSLSYDTARGERHPACLALREEAVTAARAVDPADSARADLLYRALDGYQRELYTLGRRAEGLAVRAEMLSIGRAQAAASGDLTVKGLRDWAAGLSEEGRHAEAADSLTEWVTAIRPDGPGDGSLAWSLLEWAAALDAAGLADQAGAAFEEIVSTETADAANARGPMACHLYALIRYAQMLDTRRQREQATSVRREALAVLTELAATGERKSWSGYQASFWSVLLAISGAESERWAPRDPRPPFGAKPGQWSPDARRRYFDGREALREEKDTLAQRAAMDPDRHLAELVRVHRVLTVRSAVYWEFQTHLFPERTHLLFDEGVDLARRLFEHHPAHEAPALVTALMDRSTFRAAAMEFGPALDDFSQALHLLGEAG
ncbi:hypothetical protein QMK19_39430 [Streptomyces sp. H10-C2]|uniref:hypothetical protein n=1 Tax=Streptomyces sp. H10-C2 TaxID=3046210 RepID=UPI0024BB5AEC|nr:hypothetical protein [Streptomyces sp. H10-C2]MDJ0375501.1 hypothetical protein [Streptomyces sp. H10-C2]